MNFLIKLLKFWMRNIERNYDKISNNNFFNLDLISKVFAKLIDSIFIYKTGYKMNTSNDFNNK